MPLPPGFPVTPSRISITQINILIRKAIRDIATKGFWGRILGMAFEFFIIEEVVSTLTQVATTVKAGIMLWWVDNHPATAATWVQSIADVVTRQSDLATKLAGVTLTQITGVDINTGRIATAANLGDRAAYQQTLGQEFTKVVDNMLSVPEAQRDFAGRTDSSGSLSNLHQFFGINMDFQLRSLTIATISSIFGLEPLRHLEGLHQSINWAFGLGWLSWSVISNAMDVMVNQGVKQHYLRQVKPHDLSVSESNKAWIRGLITDQTWNEIQANAGVRDDAKQWRLQMEYKQPSVGELKVGYLHGLATQQNVTDELKTLEMTPFGITLASQEIFNQRKWREEEAVAAEKLRHLRLGWEDQNAARSRLTALGWDADAISLALESHSTERVFHLRDAISKEHIKLLGHKLEQDADTRTWLASQGWTDEDIQLAIQLAHLEQLTSRVHPPKHLTVGEIVAFVATGFWSVAKGQAYLVNLGYNIDDVNQLLGYGILNHAISITPKKVRDACETDQHLANLLTSALTAVQVLDPTQILSQSDYARLITCYISSLQPASTTPPPPPVVGPPAPTFLVGVASEGKVDLSWQPVPVLVDYQVYRRSIGDAFFSPVGLASPATSLTDSGLTKGQIYVYVVRSKLAGVESVNSNEVQVTIL